jgi:Ca-activated chloride channel family protein
MHCEKAEMLLAQVVFNEIDSSSQDGVELSAHLAGCQACSALLNDMRVAAGLAREGLQAGAAPVLSRERRAALLKKAADIHAKKAAAGRRLGARTRRNFIIGSAAAAAAAMVMVGLMMPGSDGGVRGWSMSPRAEPARPPCAPVCRAPDHASAPAPTDNPVFYWSETEKRDIFKESDEKAPPGPAMGLEKNLQAGLGTIGKLAGAGPGGEAREGGGRHKAPVTRNPSGERGKLNTPSPVVVSKPEPGPATPPDKWRFSKSLTPPPGPPRQPAADSPARPVIVHGDVEVTDHSETDNRMDKNSARGQEDAISDIPIGGTGLAGSVGVGGRKEKGREGEKETSTSREFSARSGKDLLEKKKEEGEGAKIAKMLDALATEQRKLNDETAKSRTLSPRARAAEELLKGDKDREEEKSVTIVTDGTASMSTPAPFIVLTPGQAELGQQQQQQGQQGEQGPAKQQPAGEDEKARILEVQSTQAPETAVENPAIVHERVENEALPAGAVFKVVPVNPFVMAAQDRLSTFALDVDTASYSIARRYIRSGYLPPVGSVRMEEFVNAFDYNYPRRTEGTFTVISEAAPAPFGQDLVLLKVGVRGRVLGREGRKSAHLVFVVDASGSMDQPDRMPLVKYALGELVSQLGPNDRVSLVAYGTKPRLVLDGASAADRGAIAAALGSIQCEGSTNLLEGLELGYRLAARNFVPGAINRVILCSDGAANIGITASDDILDRVRGFRDQGISCTSVGFGAGTYNDELLEKLANNGDGSYVFVDSRQEARRVFVEEMSATLQTIAKDAKVQVEFDPHRVRRYRLIGYENRDIADEKFRDDTVDAGEVGSGQSATALYELELQGAPGADLGTVFVRYRNVDTGGVEEISHRLEGASVRKRTPESDPRFFLAACAAEFAELLRGSEHAAGGSFDALRPVLEETAAQPALRGNARVQELLDLVRRAKGLPRAN